jgi:thiol-disulfide isomerase/thioredoxin
MPSRPLSACAIAFLVFCALELSVNAVAASQIEQDQPSQASKPSAAQQTPPARLPSPEEELQHALADAGNDRAAVVRNLESYLAKFPESPQRPQIYRALVEACIQLRDNTRAANYAERIIALRPDDISMTILTIQLLERSGDEAGLRRAANYATRVLEFVDRSSPEEKSPRISQEEWIAERKRDRSSVLSLRGRLKMKLKDPSAAQKDFEASYAILPSAAAAEQLGEIAELKKDLNSAIQQYARAFALGDSSNGSAGRRAMRQKLGNVWRLAHGSDDGLGEYLLKTYDEVSEAANGTKARRNADAHELAEFTLRKAPEGTPFPLKDAKGKVLVVNFWATWCGPCHALEPLFARVAAEFQGTPGALFLAADCDEDETLVPPYLAEDRPRTTVVFADGLERLFAVNSFPTVIVIDRDGKTAFRSEGFEPVAFEQDLTAAVRRALGAANAPAATGSKKTP